jgi:hypothetical protein
MNFLHRDMRDGSAWSQNPDDDAVIVNASESTPYALAA